MDGLIERARRWARDGRIGSLDRDYDSDDQARLEQVFAEAMAEARAAALEEAADICDMRSFSERDAGPLRAVAKRIRALIKEST